jgi:hypothetical protein
MLHDDRREASGNPVYDTFMGVLRHPMLGSVHLKMLYDIRLPWALVFLISLSCAIKQGRQEGSISAGAWFMVLAHFLYANATHKARPSALCSAYQAPAMILQASDLAMCTACLRHCNTQVSKHCRLRNMLIVSLKCSTECCS